MTRPYPVDNPFPSQAASGLPGDPATIVELETLSDVTLPRAEFGRAWDFVKDYVEQHGSSAEGQFVALLGEHGSGKTHTINYLIAESKKLQDPSAPQRNPFHISVKLETTDLGTFYRSVFTQIEEKPLRELMTIARDHLAIDQFKTLPEVDETKAEKLRGDRKAAERLLAAYLIDRGALEKQQVDEISRIPHGREDFQRALPFIFGRDPERATAAYNWLAGKRVEASDLRAIGVSGPIDSVEMYKSGLQLLAALFRAARRPFLLYLDQFEKLVGVTQESDVLNEQNAGMLRRLIDVFPRELGLLLIAGTPLAWRKMASDLRERFGQKVIELRSLSDQEATDLVGLFLKNPTDTFPFEQSGIDAVLRFSRGNIRRFLQYCSTMFALGQKAGETIEAADVEAAIRKDLLRPPEEELVIMAAIERHLAANGLRWVRNSHIYSQTVDYSIPAEKDRPGIVIELTRAVYKDDETRQAQKLIDLADDVRRLFGPSSIVIAVVVGYSTREVSNIIGTAIRQVFYDPQTFAGEFRSALKPAAVVSVTAVPAPDAVRGELRALRQELTRMQSMRDGEVEALTERIRVLLDRQPAAEQTIPPSLLVERWQNERTRLEGAIQGTRAERKEAEFQKLWRAALMVEHEWRDRHLRMGLPILAAVAGALIFWLLFAKFIYSTDLLFSFFAFLVVLIIVGVVVVISYFRYLQPQDLRRAMRPVDTLDDLEQLHFEHASAAGRRLFHPQPQVRYVAARSVRYHEFDAVRLAKSLPYERIPLVREAQALALAGEGLDTYELDELFTGRVPEVAYVVERNPPSPYVDERLEIASELGHRMMDPYFSRYGPVHDLSAAFLNGTVGPHLASSTTRVAAKTALRALSPLEDGLGALHKLKCIDLVDQLYLFWAEVLFYLERVRPS